MCESFAHAGRCCARRNSRRFFVVCVFLGMFAWIARTWATPGQITNLGTIGGTDSFGWDVNSAGQVAGSSLTDSNATTHAFLYHEYVLIDLSYGTPFSESRGINELGEVVGNFTKSNTSHAFRYDPI